MKEFQKAIILGRKHDTGRGLGLFSFVGVGGSDETRSGEGSPYARLSQTGSARLLGNLVTGEHSDAFSLLGSVDYDIP